MFEQYGERHDINEGEEFIQWLKEVKLRDTHKWQIFTEDNKPISPAPPEPQNNQGSTVVNTDKSKGENVAPFNPTEMEVADVVELSVRKAREVIPTIQDIQLLKYAEKIASQRTGKDSLCRILMRRIQELSVSSRR